MKFPEILPHLVKFHPEHDLIAGYHRPLEAHLIHAHQVVQVAVATDLRG